MHVHEIDYSLQREDDDGDYHLDVTVCGTFYHGYLEDWWIEPKQLKTTPTENSLMVNALYESYNHA